MGLHAALRLLLNISSPAVGSCLLMPSSYLPCCGSTHFCGSQLGRRCLLAYMPTFYSIHGTYSGRGAPATLHHAILLESIAFNIPMLYQLPPPFPHPPDSPVPLCWDVAATPAFHLPFLRAAHRAALYARHTCHAGSLRYHITTTYRITHAKIVLPRTRAGLFLLRFMADCCGFCGCRYTVYAI